MDWDRKSFVLWLPADAGYPTADDFANNVAAIKYDHAIEALRDVYARHDEPVPPNEKPWMHWNDGTIFTPGQVGCAGRVQRRGQGTRRAGSPTAF